MPTNVKNLVHQSLSFLLCCVEQLGAFIVYSLSFNLADLNWPKVELTIEVTFEFSSRSDRRAHPVSGLADLRLHHPRVGVAMSRQRQKVNRRYRHHDVASTSMSLGAGSFLRRCRVEFRRTKSCSKSRAETVVDIA